MNKSIDDRLKDFFYQVRDGLYTINKEEGRAFFEKVDDEYLNDFSKYLKWYNKATPKDKDVSACNSLDFLNSEEFKKWPDEKKAFAFQEYGEMYSGIKKEDSKDDLITLEDYKTLIKNNPTWSPYLKAVAAYLIPEAELAKITFKDLEEIGFASWPADYQADFLKANTDKTDLGLSKSFSDLLKNPVFKKVSSGAKKELFTIVYMLKGEYDYNIKFSDFGFSLADEYTLWQSFVNKDFKTDTKAIEILNKLHLDGKLGNLKVDDVKKIPEFTTLPPEQKLLLISYAKDLKMEHIESIDKISEVDVADVFFSDDPGNLEYPDFLGKIAANKDGGLTLASLTKSKLPYFAKIEASNYLEFEDDKNEKDEVTLSADQKKSAALKLVSYPYGTDLFFQKVLESDKNDVDKDLLQAESMLLETITAAQTLSKELGLEQADIEKLNALSKEINENKSKPLEERIGTLRKIGRVILNILEVPLSIFPLTFAKEARSWFFNPSKQMQYNGSKKQKEELGGILSRVKSQNKEKGDQEKEGNEK